jgi:bifunctional non-homologous end joining protein LigD
MSLSEMNRRLAASKAAFIEPCLPTLAAQPPNGSGWIHEIKHDGYRLQARRDGDGVHLITRNGFDWTGRYPSIAAAVKALRCKSCTIDGEVVVVDDNGLATFDALRYGAREKPEALLYAFDLLELDGEDLRAQPIEARKAALAKLLKRKETPDIHYVDHLEFDDAAMIFDHACNLGCEGIVSKRLGSRYTSGRSRDWIKTKNPDAPGARRLEEEDWNVDVKPVDEGLRVGAFM